MLIIFSLICFASSQSIIRNGNCFFKFQNSTSISQPAIIYTQTRGRDGYAFFAISSRNDSFGDALVFMSYLTVNQQFVNRYIGANSNFPLSFQIYNRTVQDDGIYINYIDRNFYPRGMFVTDFYITINLNQTLFLQKYGTKFWVIIGINSNYPSSPTSFNTEPQEIYSFEYDLTKDIPTFGVDGPTLRLETMHISIYIISLVFIVGLFVLSIVFSSRQPLYSRGVTPYIACIFQFIVLFADFASFFMKLIDFRYYCLVTDLIQKPLLFCLVFLSGLHFFRYVVLLNLGKKKNIIVAENNENPGKVRSLFRCLKICGKWYINLIIILVVAISYSILGVIIFFINGMDCARLVLSFGFYVTFLILVLIFMIITVIIDLFSNLDKCKTCQLLLFWKEDIFLYRFEIYFFAVFLGFIIFLIAIILPFIFRAVSHQYSGMANAVTVTLTYIILLSGQVIYPLIITILQLIREFINPPPSDDMLTAILNDKLGHEIFFKFAKSEYSIENIACWDDIQKYKEEKDQVIKKQLSRQIFEKYLNGDEAELEVNVPRKLCTVVLEKIETGEIAKHLFNDIENALVINLSDTLTRLILTNEYSNYILQKSFILKTFGKHVEQKF